MSLFGEIRIPGLVDMHVHFREPGFAYKETIQTGSKAAMCAGYSDVFTMPNVFPAPDSMDHLRAQQDIIARDSLMASIRMQVSPSANKARVNSLI